MPQTRLWPSVSYSDVLVEGATIRTLADLDKLRVWISSGAKSSKQQQQPRPGQPKPSLLRFNLRLIPC